MKKEIIINATADEIRVALTEDERLAEIFLEVPDKERHVGSIYLGRVERVVQGMNAAFVDIGEAQDAFLHFSDVGSALDEFRDLLDDKEDDEDDDDEEEKKPAAKAPRKGRPDAAAKAASPKPTRDTRPPAKPERNGRALPAEPEAEEELDDADAPANETDEEKEARRRRRKRGRRGGRRRRRDGSEEGESEMTHGDEPAGNEPASAEVDADDDDDKGEEASGPSANGEERKRRRRGRRGGRGRRRNRDGEPISDDASDERREERPVVEAPPPPPEPTAVEEKPKSRRTSRSTKAKESSEQAADTEVTEAPAKKRATRRTTKSAANEEESATAEPAEKPVARKRAPSKRASSKKSASDDATDSTETASAAKPAKKAPAKRAPSTKKGAAKKGGTKKKGGDDGDVKASSIDAKLPTFQTKRSGEVTIALEKGKDVVVQVTRESYASKGVRVTTKVSLPGRFLVLLPLDPAIGISRKVQNMKERRRLRRIARSILPEGHGCIIRTVAQDKDEELIRQDLQKLVDAWRGIEQKIKAADKPTLLYKDQSIANTVMRDLFTPDVNRVVIDNANLYTEIRDYVTWAAPELANKVEHYTGDEPIFDHFGIEPEMKKMFDRRVYIPAGGYIILDQTEAMMVIDVNSGRYAGKKEQELNSLRTNIESAREIARQIRLRDIGGLIVVDFIDLYDEKNRKKVYDELKKELRKDRAKSVVLPMTQFGLVQMTRQRIRQQLIQQMSEPCAACNGTGLVQSKSTVLRNIDHWLSRFRADTDEFRLTLVANPLIVDYLTEGGVSRLAKLMVKHFVRVKVVPDESLPTGEFHFFSQRRQSDITESYADTPKRR